MKPTFILLTSLGLLLICTHVLHGQCQQQPHSAPAIPAQGKQPLPKAGILRRLTRTEADIDGPGAGGHPARIVFIVTPSTDCKTISVGKAVTVVYASSGTRNIAVSITEVKPPPDPDVGAVGGIAEVQPISNAADGQSTLIASTAPMPVGGGRSNRATQVGGRGYCRYCSLYKDLPLPPLANEEVIRLFEEGFDSHTLCRLVMKESVVHFDLSPRDQQYLVDNGVTLEVLTAMKARASHEPLCQNPTAAQDQGQQASQTRQGALENMPPLPSSGSAMVKIGQTIDQATKVLGTPKLIGTADSKTIYLYKNLKITFEDGKAAIIAPIQGCWPWDGGA